MALQDLQLKSQTSSSVFALKCFPRMASLSARNAQDPKRQLCFFSSSSICHCLSNQLLVCCTRTLLSPSYVTVGSLAFRMSPIPADLRKPCPPQASRHSCAASLQLHVISGFVAEMTACISATLQFWEEGGFNCNFRESRFGVEMPRIVIWSNTAY